MGTLSAYSLSAGIFLLAGYLAYKWMLATENQPGLNRSLLLIIYAGALALPLVPVVGFVAAAPASAVAGVAIGPVESVAVIGAAPVPWWLSALLWIYIAGVVATLVFTAGAFVQLLCIIRRGERVRCDGYTLVLLDGSRLSPFSWLRYIVMDRRDYAEYGPFILRHERAHLRLAHWLDLLLADVVCALMWYNPASWLMRCELRNVHEYQADRAVLLAGADARQYQILLIKKAVGRRFPSLANSLNHSKLKKRITMMCTNSTRGARRLRALVLGPAMLAALAVVNIPAVASALTDVAAARLSQASPIDSGKDTKSPAAAQPSAPADEAVVLVNHERTPEFPGGEAELYRFMAMNIKYPAEAMDAGQEGRVVVGFTVQADGKVTDPRILRGVCPALDREALRIVGMMPDWIPGTRDGQPLNCSMAVPVQFKLTPSSESQPAAAQPSAPAGDTRQTDDVVVVGYSRDGKADSHTVEIDGKNVAVYVDGQKYTLSINDIDPDTIESITVTKGTPDRIEITLKK